MKIQDMIFASAFAQALTDIAEAKCRAQWNAEDREMAREYANEMVAQYELCVKESNGETE